MSATNNAAATAPGVLTPAAGPVDIGVAHERILNALVPLQPELLPLEELVGRVTAEPVLSLRTVPGCGTSAMDGFAVRSADVARPGARLTVIGTARCGRPAEMRVEPGAAVRIMTGAMMPPGADAVVRREETDDGGAVVEIRTSAAPGRDVRRAGEDMVPGNLLLPRGRRIIPSDLAACAAAGYAALAAHRRPRVGVISTGDELVPPGSSPLPGTAVDSNAVTVAAAVTAAGGEAIRFGCVRDELGLLRDVLLHAAATCDLIVTTGGVGRGDHDHVDQAVTSIGDITVRQVAMRPGRPMIAGNVDGIPFLGLPGNPVSSMVTFELFGRPAVLSLQGAARVHRRSHRAVARDLIARPNRVATYLRGLLDHGHPGATPGVHTAPPRGTGLSRVPAMADCLVALPAQGRGVSPGDDVEVIPLGADG